MKKFLIASVAAAAFCGAPALAADVPMKAGPAPAWSWTGFYVGGQGGYAWKDDGGFIWDVPNLHGGVDGGVGGVTVGYNWQVGKSLLGLEGDWSWGDIKGSLTGVPCGPVHTCFAKVDNFGTARVRLGMLPTSNVLLYATGGAAWGHELRDLTPPGAPQWKNGSGWTVGGGAEVMAAPNWTYKVEYLYVDLGNPFYPATVAAVASHVKVGFNVVRVGVNYKFGSW